MQKIPARQRAPQESARWQFFWSVAWIIPLGKSREKTHEMTRKYFDSMIFLGLHIYLSHRNQRVIDIFSDY